MAAAGFHDLGLVIIDEEQRFGEAQKRRLRSFGPEAHTLVMTATPLPRSLQTTLVGLIDLVEAEPRGGACSGFLLYYERKGVPAVVEARHRRWRG